MPRPANPGWSPKTIKLSNEVIEAVWVQAAREGKTPGRLINDILASVLRQPADAAEGSTGQEATASATPAMEQTATNQRAHVVTAELPLQPEATPLGEQAAVSTGEPIDPEHVTLIEMLKEPHKYRLGNRIIFFQELSQRYGQEINFREFFRWRDQSRIPSPLVPVVRELIEEKVRAKRFKRVSSRS